MPEKLSVRAKEGLVCPHAAPLAGFVGYELVTDQLRDGDHVMPDGPSYRRKAAGELVPNNAYYRRALARGDIESAVEEDEDEPESAPSESEG